jgi:hypothetical protein
MIMLKNAVHSVREFRAISDQEAIDIARGNQPFNFAQYISILKSTADAYDLRVRKKPSLPPRRVNYTHTEDADDSVSDQDIATELIAYVTEQTRRDTPFRPRMEGETWRSLSPEAKTIWDQLDDDNKGKILASAKRKTAFNGGGPPRDRDRRPRQTRFANIAELCCDDETPLQVNISESGSAAAKTDTATTSDETKSSVRTDNTPRPASESKTQGAHPGNISRMLSKSASKSPTRPTQKLSGYNVMFTAANHDTSAPQVVSSRGVKNFSDSDDELVLEPSIRELKAYCTDTGTLSRQDWRTQLDSEPDLLEDNYGDGQDLFGPFRECDDAIDAYWSDSLPDFDGVTEIPEGEATNSWEINTHVITEYYSQETGEFIEEDDGESYSDSESGSYCDLAALGERVREDKRLAALDVPKGYEYPPDVSYRDEWPEFDLMHQTPNDEGPDPYNSDEDEMLADEDQDFWQGNW